MIKFLFILVAVGAEWLLSALGMMWIAAAVHGWWATVPLMDFGQAFSVAVAVSAFLAMVAFCGAVVKEILSS